MQWCHVDSLWRHISWHWRHIYWRHDISWLWRHICIWLWRRINSANSSEGQCKFHLWINVISDVCGIRWFLSTGSEIFAKTGQRKSEISRKIHLVIAPGKKGSLSVGMSGKQFGELIQRFIAVSGKNRKPLMSFCIPALEIQSTRFES